MVEPRLIPLTDVPDLIHELTGSLKPKVGTIRNWCDRGYFRSRKIGGTVMVETESVHDHINGKKEHDS